MPLGLQRRAAGGRCGLAGAVIDRDEDAVVDAVVVLGGADRKGEPRRVEGNAEGAAIGDGPADLAVARGGDDQVAAGNQRAALAFRSDGIGDAGIIESSREAAAHEAGGEGDTHRNRHRVVAGGALAGELQVAAAAEAAAGHGAAHSRLVGRGIQRVHAHQVLRPHGAHRHAAAAGGERSGADARTHTRLQLLVIGGTEADRARGLQIHILNAAEHIAPHGVDGIGAATGKRDGGSAGKRQCQRNGCGGGLDGRGRITGIWPRLVSNDRQAGQRFSSAPDPPHAALHLIVQGVARQGDTDRAADRCGTAEVGPQGRPPGGGINGRGVLGLHRHGAGLEHGPGCGVRLVLSQVGEQGLQGPVRGLGAGAVQGDADLVGDAKSSRKAVHIGRDRAALFGLEGEITAEVKVAAADARLQQVALPRPAARNDHRVDIGLGIAAADPAVALGFADEVAAQGHADRSSGG